MCGMVVLAPLPLGSTGPIANVALELMAVLAVAAAAASFQVSRVSLAAVLAVAALTVCQIVPLPPVIHAGICPGSREAWEASGAVAEDQWLPVSVNPGLTAAAGRRMTLYIALTCAAAHILQVEAYRAWIIRAMAASAVALALLGVAVPAERVKTRVVLGYFDLTGPVDWWRTPARQPWATGAFGQVSMIPAGEAQFGLVSWGVGDGFGPYVISNHFAAGFYLCLPALAALVWAAGVRYASACVALSSVGSLFAIGVYVIGAMASSRAGAAAAALTGLVFCAIVTEGRILQRVLAVTASVYAALLVCLVVALHVSTPASINSLPSILQRSWASFLSDPRVDATAVAFDLFARSPLLGWGLGTFGELSVTGTKSGVVLYYAHNEYAQLLAEAGIIGALIAILLIGWLMYRFRVYLSIARGGQVVAGAVARAGLAGLAFHSALDWNLHVPANVCLASIVGGLAIASSYPNACVGSIDKKRGCNPRLCGLGVAISSVLVALFVRDCISDMAENELRRAIAVANHARSKSLTKQADQELRTAIANGERVSGYDPRNANLAILIADAHLLRAVLAGPEAAPAALAASDHWFRKATQEAARLLGLPEPRGEPARLRKKNTRSQQLH